jgi:hypothetical protein
MLRGASHIFSRSNFLIVILILISPLIARRNLRLRLARSRITIRSRSGWIPEKSEMRTSPPSTRVAWRLSPRQKEPPIVTAMRHVKYPTVDFQPICPCHAPDTTRRKNTTRQKNAAKNRAIGRKRTLNSISCGEPRSMVRRLRARHGASGAYGIDPRRFRR